MEGEDLLGADRCLRGVGARLVVGIRPAVCRNLRAEVATSKRSGVTSAFPNIPCYYIRTNFFLLIYSAYVGGGEVFLCDEWYPRETRLTSAGTVTSCRRQRR